MSQEIYPLVFAERNRSRSYYYAALLVAPIAMVTPACFVYTSWFILFRYRHHHFLTQPTLSLPFFLSTIQTFLLLYSLLELAFYIYLKFLGWRIQPPGKLEGLPEPEECVRLFERMIKSGLGGEQNMEERAGFREGLMNGKKIVSPEIEKSPAYNLRPSRRSESPLRQTLPTSAAHNNGNDNPPLLAPSPIRPKISPTSVSAIPTYLKQPASSETLSADQGLDQLRENTASPDVKVVKLEWEDPRAEEFRERLRNWFNRVPYHTLTRSDLLSWLSFATYNLPHATIHTEPSLKKRKEMEDILEKGLELLMWRTGTVFREDGKMVVPELGKEEEKGMTDASGYVNGRPSAGKAGSTASNTLKTGLKANQTSHPTSSELKTERTLESTSSSAAKVMRLTMDPVNCVTRPLIIYFFASLINWWLKTVVYRRMGAKVYRSGDMEYLLRIPDDWTEEMVEEERAPVVYIHGLGFGLLQNHFVIWSLLTRMHTHPVLVPLQPHISMDIFHPRHLKPLSRRETVESLVSACERWGFWSRTPKSTAEGEGDRAGGVVLMSHSNGSVAHTWVLKDYPTLVRRSAFVDPITFCLWEGSLCYNFCYRTPKTGMELLIQYYIASEIGIANTIQRHFDWAANSLFCEQIPDATNEERNAFFLGGKDVIVDAHRVKKYLNRHGIIEGVHMDADARHGEGLAGGALDRLLHWLETGKLDETKFGPPTSSLIHREHDRSDYFGPIGSEKKKAAPGGKSSIPANRQPLPKSSMVDSLSSSRRERFVAEKQRQPGKVHLVLISTGSVASIKIPLIWEALMRDDQFVIQIIATKPSLQFYQAEEIRSKAGHSHATNVWTDEDDVGSWQVKGDPILHIELRRWADLVFVAPCSANTLAKISSGICDNLATSFLRALSPGTPTYLFPAMNTFMYQHPLTAKQLKIVQDEIGYKVVGPMGLKELACGDVGPGAMTEWSEIVQLAKGLASGILSQVATTAATGS